MTKTRRVYVTPSPSPTKVSRVRSSPLLKPPTTASLSKKTSASQTPPPPSYTVPSLSLSSSPSPSPSPPPLQTISPVPSPLVPARATPSRPAPVGTYRMAHPVPHPDEIIPPAPGQYIHGYYVVFRGRECGIFYNWYAYSAMLLLRC